MAAAIAAAKFYVGGYLDTYMRLLKQKSIK